MFNGNFSFNKFQASPNSRVLVWSPGLITLPAWLSFSCASVRTAQVSPSTMIRGGPTNQAVCNMYGLQHEPASTNYCPYSEAFGSWIAGQGSVTLLQIDPTGGTTAALSATPANNYGIYAQPNVGGTGGAPYVLSGWIKSSSHCAVNFNYNASSAKDCGIILGTTGGVWQWYAAPSTVIVNGTGIFISDNRSEAVTDTSATSCTAAFIQLESLPYATSYIPVPSTSPVTRAASGLRFSLTNTTNFTLRYDCIMAVASTANRQQRIVADPAGNRGVLVIEGTTKMLTSSCGNYISDTTALSWVAGDKLSFRMTYNGTTSYNVTIYKNDVFYYTHTFTHNAVTNFRNTGNWIGNDAGGVNPIDTKGLSYVSLS